VARHYLFAAERLYRLEPSEVNRQACARAAAHLARIEAFGR
jgi:hypothetical protein